MDRNALLVAESTSPGLTTLANADEEVNIVASILSSMSPTVLGANTSVGRGVAVKSVLENIPPASILHLACHGVQDAMNPLRSGFCLRDGRLTVADLMRLNLRNAFFAFLSACETAKGDSKQPDQAVHLAAAILFVGFRSVIATMWQAQFFLPLDVGHKLRYIVFRRSMNDEDGPIVAEIVYTELINGEFLNPDVIPYALDMAVCKLRSMGVPPDRWAPYIHMGA